MREYETVVVLDAGLDESKVDEELGNVERIIKEGEGEVLDVQKWGRRRLAYEIDKKREGIYALVRYQSASPVVTELDRRFKLNEVLLRHLTVISRGPSEIPRYEDPEERDHRRRRDRDDRDDRRRDSRSGSRSSAPSSAGAKTEAATPAESTQPAESKEPLDAKEPAESKGQDDSADKVAATPPAVESGAAGSGTPESGPAEPPKL